MTQGTYCSSVFAATISPFGFSGRSGFPVSSAFPSFQLSGRWVFSGDSNHKKAKIQ
jgi:hypothetical protein